MSPSLLERREVAIRGDGSRLHGTLAVPRDALGIVVFAHGSGSSRLSPRNQEVAAALNRSRLATLLFDLLSDDEAADRRKVFDVPLLAARLAAAIAWLGSDGSTRRLPLGVFGASTGAAAALTAAAEEDAVAAVVSRGGRPDLAASRLRDVRAPTLLIVGSLDGVVLELNRGALALLTPESELRIVDGATHLFEEPGALAEVARLACEWFVRHLAGNA